MCDLFKPGHPTMVTSPCPPLISRQLDTVSVPDMVLFLLSLDNDWPASGPDLVSLPLSLDNGHLCLNIDWLTLSLSLCPRLPNSYAMSYSYFLLSLSNDLPPLPPSPRPGLLT